MDTKTKIYFLRWALVLFGLFLIFGLFLFMKYWPSGWVWQPSQHEYEEMIMGVYATLGVFLLLAAKNPLENRSLIWFTVWSSVVHATIMLVQAIRDPTELGHLLGDIPGLYIMAIILALLMPSKKEVSQAKI